MTTTHLPRGAVCAAGATLALILSACGDDGTTEADPSPTAEESAPAGDESPAGESPSEAPVTESVSAGPFGEGCPSLPTEGPESLEGLVERPVGEALEAYPGLSALRQALAAADLGSTLDAQQGVTVLAPDDSAFAAIPPGTLQQLLADPARLAGILSFHVLPGELAPDELAGEQVTVDGATVTIEGSGEDFTVPAEFTLDGQDPATVVCGNIQAVNATVYVIDDVLQPPAG